MLLELKLATKVFSKASAYGVRGNKRYNALQIQQQFILHELVAFSEVYYKILRSLALKQKNNFATANSKYAILSF